MKKRWTNEDTTLLIDLFNSKKSNNDISKLLNRTYISVKSKLIRLNKKKLKKWSQEEMNLAIKLLKEGKNFKKISTLINRSQNSVTKKLTRAGYKFTNFKISNYVNISSNKKEKIGSIKNVTYDNVNWKLIQEFYENSNYRGIVKQFNLSPKAISWAQKNNKLKLRTQKEAVKKRLTEGGYNKSSVRGIRRYRQLCEFNFNLSDYPTEFNFGLIKKHGWYTAKNRGDNKNGVSRDHMYSIKEGFINGVLPEIIKHPANCELITQNENNLKKTKCSITLEELCKKIKIWNFNYSIL